MADLIALHQKTVCTKLTRSAPPYCVFIPSALSPLLLTVLSWFPLQFLLFHNIVSILTAFPPQCHAPPTIINTYVYFTKLPHILHLLDEMNKYVVGHYLRFNAIPLDEGFGPCWQQVHSTPTDHLFVHTVQDDYTAHMKANEIIATPLVEMKRGLWELHVIINESSQHIPEPDSIVGGNHTYMPPLPTNYKSNTTRDTFVLCAPASSHILLFRFHHAIGDGVSLMSVFSKIMKDEHGVTLESQLATYKQPSSTAPVSSLAITPTTKATPAHPIATAWSFLKSFVKTISVPAGIFDTPFLFNQCRGDTLITYNNTRDVVTIPPLSLDCIKEIKNAAKVTVNDVLFCGLTGALQRYAKAVNDPRLGDTPTNKQNVRALLPIAKPRDQTTHNDPLLGMSNTFAFVSTDMHFQSTDIRERLEHIHNTTTQLKTGTDVAASFFCTMLAFRVLPISIAQDTAGQLFSRHSLVFSNVPGPDTVYLGGERVQAIQMVYPNLITQVGVISLNNRLFMNLTLDSTEIPEAHRIGPLMIEELEAIAKEFNVTWKSGSF